MKITTRIVLTTLALAPVSSAYAVISYNQDITGNIIMGDGTISNGSFTVDRAGGVELGLRGKLRYDDSLPNAGAKNIFNSNGDGTYTFNAGTAANRPAGRAEWSYEWSINSNYDGTSGFNLNDLTYVLSMSSTNAASMAEFDPINQTLKDHGIGTNLTANGVGDDDKNARDASSYAVLIDTNNLAQNSWQPQWEGSINFDAELVGTYTYTLTAFDGTTQIASTSIDIQAVPEPSSLALLGLGGLAFLRRRR